MNEATDTIELIRNMIDSADFRQVDTKTAQDRFYFFRGTAHLFNKLDSLYHSKALSVAQCYGFKGELLKEALEFVKTEYDKYVSRYPNEYYYQSNILFDWAFNLKCDNQREAAAEMIRKATIYNLVDDYMYDGYEFFSFRPCSKYVFSEIAEETLSLVNPLLFNDPMDTVGLKWLQNQESLSVNDDQNTTFKQQREAMQNIRVRCFARSTTLPSKDHVGKSRKRQNIHKVNPLMWAHYADAHKGICIHYRFNKKLFPLHDEKMTEIFRMGNANYKSKFSINEFEIELNDALFTKSTVWKYEHEVRLVYCSTKDLPDVVKVKVPSAIKAIYFGMCCSKEDEQIIRALVTGRNIELYRMFTDINNVYQPRKKHV